MTGYHDYVLGLIPVVLLGFTLLLESLGWSLRVAVPIAGFAAATLVAHAMFVRGPVTSSPVHATSATPTAPETGSNPTPNAD